jgi:hypothetical protein
MSYLVYAPSILFPWHGVTVMKKLDLNVDRLAVESFPTGALGADGRGTVHGHAAGVAMQGSWLWTECGSCACPDTSVIPARLRRRAAA